MAARKPEIAITLLVSRVCAVALYALCYGRWSLRIGNGHFRNLTEQKPPNRSKQKCAQLITSVGSPCRSKFIMIGGGSRFPIWVKLSTGGFFRCFVQQAHSRPQALESHILYINRRGFGQGCAFGGPIHISYPVGMLPPKIPSFRDVNGDFQLKRLCVYLDTEETDQNA